jgi:CHAT domain-containing protein
MLLIFIVSACAYGLISTETRMLMNNRYTNLIQMVEARNTTISATSLQDLYWLSIAYSKTKNYRKFFPAVEEMQRKIETRKNIRHGDYIYFRDIKHLPDLLKAEVLIDLGQYRQSVKAARRAMITGHAHDQSSVRIFALGYMGVAYALGGDPKNAIKTAAAMERLDIHLPGSVLSDEKAIGLAKIHMALGNYHKALKALKSSALGAQLMKQTELGGTGFVGESTDVFTATPRQYMFFKCLLETGEMDTAKTGFDLLLMQPRILENRDIYRLTLFDRGRIAEREHRSQEAILFFQRAVEVIEKQRSSINTEASKIGFIGNKQEVYFRLVVALVNEQRSKEAFIYAERSKARALVDMLAKKKTFGGGTHGNRKQINQWLSQMDRWEMAAIRQESAIPDTQKHDISNITRKHKMLIQAQAPQLATLVTVRPPRISEIQKKISANETLLEYYGYKNRFFAFTLSKEKVTATTLPAAELHDDVHRFRKAIIPTQDQIRSIREAMDSGLQFAHPEYREMLNRAESLYDALIRPVRDHLKTGHMTIIPHGALHYLPFNALYTDGRFLIERYHIRILPSAGVMMFLNGHPKNYAGNLLAFGNPDLGDENMDLPNAEEETRAITKNRLNDRLFTGKNATETALKEFGGQYRYIHLAAHSTFYADRPLSSGLLLARDRLNDGRLTARELYDLDLPAELVTLSACETGLEKVFNGDDMVGLTRGFFFAGVRSVISSLWRVDDRATAILMSKFYHNLDGNAKGESLRMAQLNVKNDYHPHPYFWAAFQITGAIE